MPSAVATGKSRGTIIIIMALGSIKSPAKNSKIFTKIKNRMGPTWAFIKNCAISCGTFSSVKKWAKIIAFAIINIIIADVFAASKNVEYSSLHLISR